MLWKVNSASAIVEVFFNILFFRNFEKMEGILFQNTDASKRLSIMDLKKSRYYMVVKKKKIFKIQIISPHPTYI